MTGNVASHGLTTQPPFIAHFLRFVLAVPLLGFVIVPIYMRRTRRGLNQEMARRNTCMGDGKVSSNPKEA